MLKNTYSVHCSLFTVHIFILVQSKAKQISKFKSLSLIYHEPWALSVVLLHICMLHAWNLLYTQTNNICLACLLLQGRHFQLTNNEYHRQGWYSQTIFNVQRSLCVCFANIIVCCVFNRITKLLSLGKGYLHIYAEWIILK